MISHFCHIYCHSPQNDLNRALKKFEEAGFLISPRRARHPAGHLNGFIHLTRSYLELISIVDEEEYHREADESERYFRLHPQPYGIGAMTVNSLTVYESLSQFYPGTPKPYSRGEANSANTEPHWTFIELPKEATPGATVFTTEYHRLGPPEFRQGSNKVFALGGFWFCSDLPDSDYKAWSTTLSCSASEFKPDDSRSRGLLRFQELRWLATHEYREMFGLEWKTAPVPYGGLAAVLLYSSDLELSKQCMQSAGFNWLTTQDGYCTFRPDADTGYTFVLKQMDPQWLLGRLAF